MWQLCWTYSEKDSVFYFFLWNNIRTPTLGYEVRMYIKIQILRTYWRTPCFKIAYVNVHGEKNICSALLYRNFHPFFKTPSEFHGIFTWPPSEFRISIGGIVFFFLEKPIHCKDFPDCIVVITQKWRILSFCHKDNVQRKNPPTHKQSFPWLLWVMNVAQSFIGGILFQEVWTVKFDNSTLEIKPPAVLKCKVFGHSSDRTENLKLPMIFDNFQ